MDHESGADLSLSQKLFAQGLLQQPGLQLQGFPGGVSVQQGYLRAFF